MKTVTVEMTDAQFDYLKTVADSMPRTTVSDVLVATSFGWFAVEYEDTIELLASGLRDFAVQGRLPANGPDFYEMGHELAPLEVTPADANDTAPERLGDELAYEVAQSRLDSFCDSVDMEGVPENLREGWRDLDTIEDGPGHKHDVDRAVQWLDSRGLLERWRADEPNLVRVRPLSAAKAQPAAATC